MDGYFARDAFDVDGLHIRKSAKITSEIENLPRIAIKPQYGRVRLVECLTIIRVNSILSAPSPLAINLGLYTGT